MNQASISTTAVVAIGRNEGNRLRRCLESVVRHNVMVVYVDSGSTDDSVAMAKELGAEVVELCMKTKFTAARARNAGFEHLIAQAPDVEYVQFVDGDCELEPEWLPQARDHLKNHESVCAVFGRRSERFPTHSIYNKLCDMEWNVPPGEVAYFGGDVMIRAAALKSVGGYNATLIAGEEPELGIRLRREGWSFECLDAAMTKHDAAITKFSEWWRRIRRSGYAYAAGAWLHGSASERHFLWETRRALLWGLILPLTLLGATLLYPPLILSFGVYPAQVVRLYFHDSGSPRERLLRALFNMVNKFPEAIGILQFHRDRLLERESKIIEYHS